MDEIKLNKELIRQIEQILANGKNAELAIRNGKVILWSVTSKKKYEQATV